MNKTPEYLALVNKIKELAESQPNYNICFVVYEVGTEHNAVMGNLCQVCAKEVLERLINQLGLTHTLEHATSSSRSIN